MERRNFLKTVASASIVAPLFVNIGSISSNIVYAREVRDFSKVDPAKEALSKEYSKYKLQESDFSQIIENNVLPKNYKEDFWNLPRTLFLKDPKTGEQANIVYFKNGKIDPLGYHQVAYMMRDKHAQVMTDMDLKLLDLMCAVQAWTKVLGSNQPMIVTSGFRTEKTNNSLEGAAKNSFHKRAKAVDFVIPNIDTKTIGQIAQQFEAGGVGIYPFSKFNHLDTAHVRTWIQGKKRR